MDSTAWAVLALEPFPDAAESIVRARDYLAVRQSDNGSVPILPEAPNAVWPTPLAILAWARDADFSRALERAAAFLLDTTGVHWKRRKNEAASHDPSLRGWPWILDTHSWVGSTSLAMLALGAAGHGENERISEAVAMLRNRQLPEGGWNYGNVQVYGQTLEPLPESTGMALRALRDRVREPEVRASLGYLGAAADRVRTPLSLAWSVIGLAAWGGLPPEASRWVEETLHFERSVGGYDTTQLATVLVAGQVIDGKDPFRRGETSG